MTDIETYRINYERNYWIKHAETHGHCSAPLGAVLAVNALCDEIESLREQLWNCQQQVVRVEKERDEARANDRCAMSYLADVRAVVGGDDFPGMVRRVSAVTAERDYQKRLADEINKSLEISESDYRELEKRFNELASKYDGLLCAVGSKWPYETRHQTALRYIRAMENQANAAIAKLGADKGEK